MACANSEKLNGLVEIIAGSKDFFVRKSTIMSFIMLNGTVGFGAYFFEC
jgi:hypothetical protein